MKLVLRTLIFHILCIIIFTIIYSNLTEEFQEHDKKSFVDFILLSTSIQSGVGISDLFPLSYYSKIVIIIQQLLMLFKNQKNDLFFWIIKNSASKSISSLTS